MSWRHLLDERAYAADDVAGSISVPDDSIEGVPDFLLIRRIAAKPAQGGMGVGDRRGDRLINLVGDRGRQLPHCGDAIGVGERHVRFAVSPLALAQVFLRLLAFAQIENESDGLVPAAAEGCRTEKHGHADAIFSKVLLLESLAASRRPELCNGAFISATRFHGRQRRPADATRNEIVAAVSDNVEKGLVGLNNATLKIPDEYPDNVGIDQASDLRLAFLEIAIETGVLQRYRRLRRQQLEDRRSIRSERARGQRVFKIEQPSQPCLLDQREAEDRVGLSALQIIVLGEEVQPGGIIENHAFVRSDDIPH